MTLGIKKWTLRAVALALVLSSSLTPVAAREVTQPDTCPYTFRSAMPAGTFCVYRGAGRDQNGDLCASDLVVIWTSYNGPSGNDTDAIHLAILSDPDVVLAASAPRGEAHSAEVVGYSVDEQAGLEPTHGTITLGVPQRADDHAGDHIRVELSGNDVRPEPGTGCAVTSFSGTFMGVMTSPQATARLE